jgi:hypothetical protein
MLSRRRLLASLAIGGAGALIPAASWADVGNPSFLAAARDPSGAFAIYGLTAKGVIAFRVDLPDRGHAAAAHPTRAEAVAFARRPGTFALVLDCASGQVVRRLESPKGRHFYGHGAYLQNGDILVTTENAYDTGDGMLGVWDTRRNYTRIGEIPTGAIGPHEVIRLPGTEVLAVANGGILTHPDSSREKLNPDDMHPNLTYIQDGEIIDKVTLATELSNASIRHLSARDDGTVAAAIQWEGDLETVIPLLMLHKRGQEPRLLTADHADQRALNGYAGSVSFSGDGNKVAITGPRGNAAHIFQADTDEPPQIMRRSDICGVAKAGKGMAFTDGMGGVICPDGAMVHDLAWDNHLVSL